MWKEKILKCLNWSPENRIGKGFYFNVPLFLYIVYACVCVCVYGRILFLQFTFLMKLEGSYLITKHMNAQAAKGRRKKKKKKEELVFKK